MTPKQKRAEIKRILHLLSPKNREVFNYMYSPYDLGRPTDEVVDNMPANRLSWALSQCQSSYYRIFELLKI
jgi:hypothetical protein